MLVQLLGSLAFVIAIILFLAWRFNRLFLIEERHQAGLPYDDLLEPKVLEHPGRLVVAILAFYIGAPIVLALVVLFSPGRRREFDDMWQQLWTQDALTVAAAIFGYVLLLYVVGRVVLRYTLRD